MFVINNRIQIVYILKSPKAYLLDPEGKQPRYLILFLASLSAVEPGGRFFSNQNRPFRSMRIYIQP